jgi:hypothetical protein
MAKRYGASTHSGGANWQAANERKPPPRLYSPVAMKAAILLPLCLALSSFAAEPELKNGDFEKGKQFWRGDGKVVTLPEGGKVLELKADDKYNDEISQEIDWGKAAKMDIELRVRGVSYKGEGLRMSAAEAGSGGPGRNSQVSAEWTSVKWSFERQPSSRKFQLTFSPLPGTGAIQIDDVKISASGTAK